MEKSRKLLSVIVPCFNEGTVIDAFHAAVMQQMETLDCKYDYEIIYVNDGSTDTTQVKVQDFAADNNAVKYLSFSRNFGKESAMLAGLEYSSGDCAVIIDADLQHPPELIHEMLEKYEEGYDQVIAKRNRNGDSFKNRFFARSYYKLVKNMVDVKMTDGAGDFRLLSRAAIEAVLSLKETNRFSKGLFSWVGFDETYIEYENRKRAADETKWSFKKLLKYGIDGVISFNTQPLRLCVYLGGALLVISMAYLVYLFVSIMRNGIDVPGYFTTIALISVIGGVQLISLGIIGEYVGRIYAEVKNRPAYIIADTNIQEGTENEG
ncbi:MAG: glycosyltransferase family 2 protein [Firmicutes bacterium]|nr:glycosyltransferase family 2 protein [Bacillota bacterium]